jgi:hypothetical protein
LRPCLDDDGGIRRLPFFTCAGHAFGIWNDYENNTHPPEFTIIDPFWHDVVVVAANEPGTTELIDLISMSANGTTASEYVCSCRCNCHEEQSTSSTTVQLAQRFDQAMESAADSWNKVRQQTEWAATDLRNAFVNGYYNPTIYHRLLTTATETKTATVEYIMSDSVFVSTHTASDFLRSLLSPFLQRSSPPPPTIAIDEENSTKNRTISTYFLAMYDDNYNQHTAATMVDPCHLSKYDLGFPFGLLLADGFFQSAHVPV